MPFGHINDILNIFRYFSLFDDDHQNMQVNGFHASSTEAVNGGVGCSRKAQMGTANSAEILTNIGRSSASGMAAYSIGS